MESPVVFQRKREGGVRGLCIAEFSCEGEGEGFKVKLKVKVKGKQNIRGKNFTSEATTHRSEKRDCRSCLCRVLDPQIPDRRNFHIP
jgi:hypothetical protein